LRTGGFVPHGEDAVSEDLPVANVAEQLRPGVFAARLPAANIGRHGGIGAHGVAFIEVREGRFAEDQAFGFDHVPTIK
jgi:hypothetical protein